MFRAAKRFSLLKVKLKNTEPTGIRTISTCLPHCCSQDVVSEDSLCGPHSQFKEGYGKIIPPLSQPLPGLKLPPCLPDHVEECLTRITTLPNGLKIASQESLGPASCIGIFVDCGSICESEWCYGVTHLLERMAFKSTNNRCHSRVVREIEAVGGNVAASASREQMGYTYDTIRTHLPEALELLIDCVRNPIFLDSEVKEQLTKIKAEIRDVSNNPENFLLESLHSAGYSGALGNPLIASEAVIEKLNGSVIDKFVIENYTADRMVLAASGVDHEYLLSIAEPLLYDLEKGPPIKVPVSKYVGGDLRFQADSERTYVALVFEVPGGWRDEKDAIITIVLQNLMGGGGSFSAGGPGKGMHSRLYIRVLNEYQQIQSFSAFSTVYNDTGLFGIRASTGSDFVAEAVDIAAEELIAIATPGKVKEVELIRAKNSTKSAVLMNLESRMVVTEDIGRQILTYGCRKHVEHFLKAVDAITLDDLSATAHKILSSPVTMGSWGD
ncbi:hypothetical protein AMTR_s00030p00236070, partial [Amborella trichopoda]